ncbi:hypothetical protein B0H15DRAFT_869576 [Mycena belliarum]|uniref:Uncharacterized protein n=1 Tax=Mycena belliarum TaxID=1033014 RepID=A0AAD6TPZ3_9AGAR|nr:hypothetical protein B0H15DRAFT_869576 [Mycena belliae]
MRVIRVSLSTSGTAQVLDERPASGMLPPSILRIWSYNRPVGTFYLILTPSNSIGCVLWVHILCGAKVHRSDVLLAVGIYPGRFPSASVRSRVKYHVAHGRRIPSTQKLYNSSTPPETLLGNSRHWVPYLGVLLKFLIAVGRFRQIYHPRISWYVFQHTARCGIVRPRMAVDQRRVSSLPSEPHHRDLDQYGVELGLNPVRSHGGET